MDKNLLGRWKRAIARITYACDKLGFCKSGHIYVYMFVDQKLNRTLAIDSSFQSFSVGLLVEFID